LSTIDLVFLIVWLCSVSIFASLGVTKAVGLALGVLVSFLVLTPLLVGSVSDFCATVIGVVVGNQGMSPDKGLARGLTLGVVVLIGLVLGGWLGSVLTLPFKIIPGLNLLNTLGGAVLGFLVGLFLVGATFVIMTISFPTWSQTQLGQSNFVSTFLAHGLGELVLIVVPSEWKQFSLPLPPFPVINFLY